LAPFRGATPSLEILTARAEFDNGWSRQVSILRGVAFLERVRTVKHPDIAMGIRRRSTDTTQQHMLRHRGKFWVDLENREDWLGDLWDGRWNPAEKDHQYHCSENCDDLLFHVKASYSPPRLLAEEGWLRHQKNAAKLPQRRRPLRYSSTRSLLCRHRHARDL